METPETTLHLARWDTRFWAWLIDFILVSLVLNIFVNPFHLFQSLIALSFFDIILRNFGFWIYWTALEGWHGQSIGKMVMNIRLTDRKGAKTDIPAVAIASFGKSFLLPIDCLIGWLGMPGKKLRLFNRVSHTIVIKTLYEEPEGFRYEKDTE